MTTKVKTSNSGIGIGGAVFCIFLTLKLVAIQPVASWSWWWVTAPLWGGIAIALIVGLAAVLVAAVLERRGRH